MNYFNGYQPNTYGNTSTLNQSGFGGINYQPQQQFGSQPTNYGLKMGVQFASKEEMDGLILPPNAQAIALGKEGDVFYVKSADGLGRSTLKIFDFTERIEGKPVIDYATKEDLGMFVVKEDLTALSNKIIALENKVANIGKVNNVSRETMGSNYGTTK